MYELEVYARFATRERMTDADIAIKMAYRYITLQAPLNDWIHSILLNTLIECNNKAHLILLLKF